MPLEDFFLDYGKQDRRPGEFVEAVEVPAPSAAGLRGYKLSKRFDQDISAVCGAFDIRVEGGRVAAARIAFGGMARHAEARRRRRGGAHRQALERGDASRPPPRLARDFTPLTDMRASAAYRLSGARNLRRVWAEARARRPPCWRSQP